MKEKQEKKEPLYMEVYHRYQELILTGQLASGMQMPSIRRATAEWKLSRTTIENAYLQLAADGYIISHPQSGYFVTDIAAAQRSRHFREAAQNPVDYRYDFASSGVDRESFRFDLWQRYIRSALRKDERLLTYGEAQGEPDFRETLADYVRMRRNIHCSPDNIIVGAGVQNLLQILCPILKKGRQTISFPTPSFLQGSTIFSDYGFDIRYRNKDCDIIYVSPAHMTAWGEIMPVKRRMELIHYAAEHKSLIIEDDYENEFVYLQKPTPSLYGLSGNQNVIYLGSFSRLLLPSIRISFMILPDPLLRLYREKMNRYNQTASKAEQIALCQFIRDGHLAAQTRRLKRLYEKKEKALLLALTDTFGETIGIRRGEAGTRLAVTVPTKKSGREITELAEREHLRFRIHAETESTVTLLLSCSAMPAEDFRPALLILKNILEAK